MFPFYLVFYILLRKYLRVHSHVVFCKLAFQLVPFVLQTLRLRFAFGMEFSLALLCACVCNSGGVWSRLPPGG